jgi:hypothetical protein
MMPANGHDEGTPMSNQGCRQMWRGFVVLGVVGCVTPPPTLDDYGWQSDTEVVIDTDDSDVVPDPSGPRILVLNDGGSADQVVAALRAGGLSVVKGPNYQSWDGAAPALDGFDGVVFLQGATFLPRLTGPADTALREFVGAGGGLVRTERAASSAASEGAMLVDQSMPVTYDDGFGSDEGWWVDDRDHPMVASIPALWNEPGAFSEVSAVATATVLISTQGSPGTPLVTIREDLPGRVVHINHDMTGTVQDLTDEMELLLAAASRWVAE